MKDGNFSKFYYLFMSSLDFFFQSDFSLSFWTNYCWLVFVNDWFGRHGICVSLLCLLRSGISPRSLFIYLFSNLDIDIGFCGLFVSLPLQGNDTRMFFFFQFMVSFILPSFVQLCCSQVPFFFHFGTSFLLSRNIIILSHENLSFCSLVLFNWNSLDEIIV